MSTAAAQAADAVTQLLQLDRGAAHLALAHEQALKLRGQQRELAPARRGRQRAQLGRIPARDRAAQAPQVRGDAVIEPETEAHREDEAEGGGAPGPDAEGQGIEERVGRREPCEQAEHGARAGDAAQQTAEPQAQAEPGARVDHAGGGAGAGGGRDSEVAHGSRSRMLGHIRGTRK